MTTRWLFADQLGPHFIDDTVENIVIIESAKAFSRSSIHRAKAHLLLSGMRHLARDSAIPVHYIKADSFEQAWKQIPQSIKHDVSVVSPTSHALVQRVHAIDVPIRVLPPRGFIASRENFQAWANGRKRLLLEDFYRHMRRTNNVLMDGQDPVGGTWNFDADNRQPPPRKTKSLGVPQPWWPEEDEVDQSVRVELDANGVSYLGQDLPRRFAVTRAEALAALEWFITHRLATFGPYEDAMMEQDWTMSHSLLSVPLNLGLLDPLEVVLAVQQADAPIASKEGFIRQILGWREWTWHLYWHLGPQYLTRNELQANEPVPNWFTTLDSHEVSARCLSTTLKDIDSYGWVHHIPRLMILGNWALQRGYLPSQMITWFTDSFVDGFEWVMAANVIGMALHADGGVMATKPYASGGAYIKRMSNYCQSCPYSPDIRVGENACPFSAGYWAFLARHESRFANNHRMATPLMGLRRLRDLPELIAQETARGNVAP